MKKNSKPKQTKSNIKRGGCNDCVTGINLTYPAVFAAAALVITVIFLIAFGNLYAYYWYILPPHSASVTAFTFLYILMQVYTGAVAGYIFIRKTICYGREKLISLICVSLIFIISLLWIDIIFGSFSPFFALILILILICLTVFTALICFRKMNLISISMILILIWLLYLLRFNLCILILN